MFFHHYPFDITQVNTTSKYLSKILFATPKLVHLEEIKVQKTLKFKMVSQDIQSYAEKLEELKFNSKPHISMLTELANYFGKNRQGREVIKIIKKRILSKETPITHKMPTLYLLDSILKNHPNNYKQHIEEILASVFEAIFSSSDKKLLWLCINYDKHGPHGFNIKPSTTLM